MFISNAVIKEICSVAKENGIKLVVAEESTLGSLMVRLKDAVPEVRIVCFYHDIAADLYRQRLKNSSALGKLECLLTIRQEKINLKACDIPIVFHEADAGRFKKYYGIHPDCLIPLCMETPDTDAEILSKAVTLPEEKKKLLFVGSSYLPNILGIRWFYHNVLPGLKNNIEINIVGRGTEFLKNEFTEPGVRVIGKVDSVDSYLRDADIFIAPVFDGGGMKVKTVEAVAYAKTIVGTSESLNGFWERMDSVKNRIVYKCDSAEDWITVLNKLVCSETRKFNPELFSIFKDNFSYAVLLREMKKVLGSGTEAKL